MACEMLHRFNINSLTIGLDDLCNVLRSVAQTVSNLRIPRHTLKASWLPSISSSSIKTHLFILFISAI